MTAGLHIDATTHGRKRLVPFFGADPLAKIDEDRVREWLAEMVELVEADELSPKTINNARTCLSVALNEAVRRRLIPRNRSPLRRRLARTKDLARHVGGELVEGSVPARLGVAALRVRAVGESHSRAIAEVLELDARDGGLVHAHLRHRV